MPPKYAAIYDDPPEFYGDSNNWDRHVDRILKELRRLYDDEIKPIEDAFKYDTLRPSWFGETIAQKRPFVTILGPYSAGKSTFINYLMQSNYLLTGPQPTTDKFTVIQYGDKVQQVTGKVLCADQSQPYRGLNQFGEKFIECFGAVTAPHPILKSLSIIDTPGLLENQEGDHKRRYDYMQVCRWFVERSDLVCVLFDPTKLDAGEELKKLFDIALHGNETKIRFILNKADSVSAQELMRIYGGLFWNLSKMVRTTEPPRVYVSSFWDKPYRPDTDHDLFTDEKSDLIYDLTEVIPQQSLDNRVTSVLSRCKAVYNHLVVCTYMEGQLPIFGKAQAIKDMVNNLPNSYQELAYKNKCNPHDFPHPKEYARFFDRVDLTDLPDADKCAKKGWLNTLSRIMGQDLPALLKPLQSAPIADPRDRKHAIMVQREYSSRMQRQLVGESGIQGALGAASLPQHRAEGLPNASLMAEQMRAKQLAQNEAQIMQMVQEQQAAAQLQNQMNMQKQMMLMMQQQAMANPTLMANSMPVQNNMMGMNGMGMPNAGMGANNMNQLALMPLQPAMPQSAPIPNMSHDQLIRLTQMMQQQQPARPHQPRF